jgi:hypothetical protein
MEKKTTQRALCRLQREIYNNGEEASQALNAEARSA